MPGRWSGDISGISYSWLVIHKEHQKMTCLICKKPAQNIQTIGDFDELKCSDGCGHYRASGTLIATLRTSGRSLDVQQTRQWLAAHRVTEPAPIITSSTAIYV